MGHRCLHTQHIIHRYGVIRQHVVHLGFQNARSMLATGIYYLSALKKPMVTARATINMKTLPPMAQKYKIKNKKNKIIFLYELKNFHY